MHDPALPVEDGSRRGPPPNGGLSCDVCGAAAVERHCKIICTRCGYIRDCSDP